MIWLLWTPLQFTNSLIITRINTVLLLYSLYTLTNELLSGLIGSVQSLSVHQHQVDSTEMKHEGIKKHRRLSASTTELNRCGANICEGS